LLVALSTVGICSRVEGRYLLNELGAGLDGAAERSFKNWVIFEGSMLIRRWEGLLDSIMSGKTAAQLQDVDDNFDLMSRTPEHVRIFNDAMTDLTRLVTHDLLQAYDLSTISHLMDVGGGSGELIGAVARAYSTIRGTAFDLAEVRRRRQPALQAPRNLRSRRLCCRRFLSRGARSGRCDHLEKHYSRLG
jgi:hypothetical protein